MLDGLDQFREHVSPLPNDIGKPIQGARCVPVVAAFEALKAVHLQLLPGARGADDCHVRRIKRARTITVEADNWPRALLDLAFVAVGSRLNLAALIPLFDAGQ